MALVNRKPLYDPKDHPYPKMLYRYPGQTTGGTPVKNEEEHLAVLQQWEDEDKAAKEKAKDNKVTALKPEKVKG